MRARKFIITIIDESLIMIGSSLCGSKSNFYFRSLDKSGFDSTMVQSKGIGMAFDGEGLAYYYKDLEKASWWKSQNANWNTALSEAITANKNYIDAKVGDLLNS